MFSGIDLATFVIPVTAPIQVRLGDRLFYRKLKGGVESVAIVDVVEHPGALNRVIQVRVVRAIKDGEGNRVTPTDIFATELSNLFRL